MHPAETNTEDGSRIATQIVYSPTSFTRPSTEREEAAPSRNSHTGFPTEPASSQQTNGTAVADHDHDQAQSDHHELPLDNPSTPKTDSVDSPPISESHPIRQQQGTPESDNGTSLKKDLYVGNLYLSPYRNSLHIRHPRVQPQNLKDLFGGDEAVESVKIVPDRNVSLI
jgi:hypothetical protein